MKAVLRLLAALLLVAPGAVFAQAVNPKVPTGPAADFVAPGPIVALPAPIGAALDGLRASNLAAHIELLAAPALEGRGLGRPGLEASAEYVATMLALSGVRPPAGSAARDGYFQAVPIREMTNARGELTVESGVPPASRSRTFVSGVDCLFPDIAPQVLAGQVAFAGFGIREPSLGLDDYRNLDVRDKIVVVLAGLPAGEEWRKPELVSRYGAEKGRARFSAKVDIAASLGARAVLAVETDAFAVALARKPPVALPYFLPADESSAANPPLIVVAPAVARALLGAERNGEKPGWGTPPTLPAVTVTIRARGDERAVFGRNVIAVIPGSDPRLRDEAVVIGAHVDHLGQAGAALYPGADDNASGVAALLEIARSYAASPVKPKRSLVFAFWTGEEEGHLGSDYYVRHPVWPLERTVAYANLDMIAHPWLSEEIRKLVSDSRLPGGDDFVARVKPADFVEPGVADWAAAELRPVLERAGRGVGLALHFDLTDGKSGGSDYRAFARKGVRFVRFFGNYFPGYHEPTDTPDGADPGQVLKMARLALATTWLLADK